MKKKGKKQFDISDYSKMMEPGGKAMTEYAKFLVEIQERIDAIVDAPSEEEVTSAEETLKELRNKLNEGDEK